MPDHMIPEHMRKMLHEKLDEALNEMRHVIILATPVTNDPDSKGIMVGTLPTDNARALMLAFAFEEHSNEQKLATENPDG